MRRKLGIGEQRAHAAFYPSVILFDDVVQVGTIWNLDGTVPTVIEFVIHAHAPQSGMGGLEAIQGNYSRLAVALESFTEEGLGGGDVTRSTELAGLSQLEAIGTRKCLKISKQAAGVFCLQCVVVLGVKTAEIGGDFR